MDRLTFDFADLYLHFHDKQEWLAETFAAMTFEQYGRFVGYCFSQLDLAAEAKDGTEFRRVKGLLLALARKDLEVAHFMEGITDEQREASLNMAQSYYELAKGFYAAEVVPAVEAAWAVSRDYGRTYGWPSVIFDVLSPQPPVFRE